MRHRLIGLAALATLSAAPAFAQGRPQTREGFTVSFGVGAGSAGITCDDCIGDRENAPTVYLRLGGAYRPNLILGGEINGWSKESAEIGAEGTITIATINAIAQWYPQPETGFFLIGGLGAGGIEVEARIPGVATVSDRTTGLGYQIGTGYDLRLGRNFSLTPYASYFGTRGGEVESNGLKLDANAVQVGIGFTWH